MTEAEWLACEDSLVILTWLEESGYKSRAPRLQSPRHQRLFNCACTRRMVSLWDDESRVAVETSEAFADEQLERSELERAFGAVGVLHGGLESLRRVWDERTGNPEAYLRREVRSAAHIAAGSDGMDLWYRYGGSAKCIARSHPESQVERAVQASLIRCIFGNPFRPVAFNPAWRTDTAVTLARQMYESRDFGAMPILADALQDAGCEDEQVLTHCREAGPHARGCWVVDGVLGKA